MAEPSGAHLVPCHKCNRPFDAGGASWCRCVVVEPSLVCPRCGECLCQAPLTARQAFWAAAPAELRSTQVQFASRAQAWVAPPNPPPSDVKRPLVLVVEDDLTMHQVLTELCEDLGATLIGTLIRAFDGRDGFQLARRYKPDLVISDVLMPKLDGREMCRLIKAEPTLAATKVVIMTGVNTSPRDQAEGVRVFRADDYLLKPFRFAALHAMLQKQLALILNDRRQSPRFDVAFKVKLSWTHPSLGLRAEEVATTNMGKAGALVASRLPVARGDVLVFEEAGGPFRTRAIIQSITIGPDNVPRLSLRFLDAELPDRLLPTSRRAPPRRH